MSPPPRPRSSEASVNNERQSQITALYSYVLFSMFLAYPSLEEWQVIIGVSNDKNSNVSIEPKYSRESELSGASYKIFNPNRGRGKIKGANGARDHGKSGWECDFKQIFLKFSSKGGYNFK